MSNRATWANLSDSELLRQCEVDTYRASGPGGQKRNKTSSAVRIRHTPTGLLVIAEESRSQHENREMALRRIRHAFYLNLRETIPEDLLNSESILELDDYREARDHQGRLHMNRKNPHFWPAVGVVLDVLVAVEARVSDAAKLLSISTANLIDFLQTEPKVWEQTGRLRAQFGQKPLRSQ